ncbi:MAG: alpha-ketoacid dehydrogenase subunit beta [Actinobacteria bacterium]|nr:alpha-ketoacid dehydrogenase subunit beta [Cyanobacteriota bacterium]MCL5770880.1 alpha-ketoacid dehydrogenase subunit beta [Actinomycetota bacterium]
MREIEYREAIKEAIIEEMDRDPKVFLLGEDIGVYGGAFRAYKGLLEKYGPERVVNTPISEQAIVGGAVGAALTGYRPVAEIMFVDFCTLAMDQIVNQAAKINFMTGDALHVPMVLRTQGGSGTGIAAQHSQSLESWFYHIPGLKLVMPATPYDVKGLLKTAIRDNDPVVFIEHKTLYLNKGPVPEEEYTIPFGVADVKREGSDITIFAYSAMLLKALAAAEELAKEGISCEVIDPRTLVPLDTDTLINSVKKTNRLVIVSEAVERGSVASDILAIVNDKAFDYLDAPVKRVCGLNTAIPYNSKLEKACIPTKESIIDAVKEIV